MHKYLPPNPKIGVLGSGRWGAAFALFMAKKGLDVRIITTRRSSYDTLVKLGASPNLKDYPFPENVRPMLVQQNEVISDDILFISTPVSFLSETLANTQIAEKSICIGINKGIENNTFLTPPEIFAGKFPNNPYVHLGGPAFPAGLLSDRSPVAETLAGTDEALLDELLELLCTKSFRLYKNNNPIGLAFLGAIKNVFAIAAGILEGKGFSEEAPAILITRGLVESRRLCAKMGIPDSMVYGLGGLGDMILTCCSPKSSRNREFGVMIGKGSSVEEVLNFFKDKETEGYHTARALYNLALKHELDMPIVTVIYKVLYEQGIIEKLLPDLMNRPFAKE